MVKMKTPSKFLYTSIFVFIVQVVFSAPSAPGGGGHPGCWPTCVPVDNGLIFLLVAAGLYGGWKLYKAHKSVKA